MKQDREITAAAKGQKSEDKKEQKEQRVIFDRRNYIWMLVGVGLIVLGFVLMAGGGSDNPAEFNYDEIFAWRRIGLAPMLCLAGFGVEVYAIMHRFKK